MIAGSNAAQPVIPGRQTAATRPDRPSRPPPIAGAAVPAQATVATRRSKAPWIVAGVLVLGGAAAAIAVAASRSEPPPVVAATPPPVTPPTPAPTPTPPPTAAPVEPPAPPPTIPVEPARVTLRFAVEPTSAVIAVDGAPVKAAELVVAKDDAVHKLRITAPGYLAHEETVRFDESQRLAVQLKRAGDPGRKDPKRDKDRTRNERIDSESPYN
jgi:fused signal recognition particle receptor